MKHNDFERIFTENYSMVVDNAYLFVKDRVAAEDIASQSFLTLMLNQDLPDLPAQAIRPILKKISYNVAYEYTKNNIRKELLTDQYNDLAIIHDSIIHNEATHNIYRSLDNLNPRAKKVMQLKIAGYTNNEIAEKMGITPDNIAVLITQARKQLKRDLFTDNEQPHISSHKQPESREQIIKIKEEVNDEFIRYYTKHPHKLYSITPRQYEIFVAELLKDMGYEVWLNNPTRDGGRDIIAVLKTPSNDSIVTIVECKKYNLDNPVPIEIVERFMYTIRDKDKANAGWIVTTSTFSREAQKCQHEYKWQLSLKDNKDLATLCSNYGKWKRTSEGSGLWLPDNPLG